MMIFKYVEAELASKRGLQSEMNHKHVGQLVYSNVPPTLRGRRIDTDRTDKGTM
jgi:hypothetical protein